MAYSHPSMNTVLGDPFQSPNPTNLAGGNHPYPENVDVTNSFGNSFGTDLTGLPLDTPNRGSIDEVVSLVQELIHKHSKVCPDSQRAAEEMRRSMTGLKQEFSKVLDAVEGLESKILKNNSTIDQGTGRPRGTDDVLSRQTQELIKRLTST